jgi:hypothetical protein
LVETHWLQVKSSLPKIFAIQFYRYLAWLKRQDLPEVRRRCLASRANHYLAYLSLSATDFKTALSNSAMRAHAWRSYRRFLKESMRYDDKMLTEARNDLGTFYAFIGAGTRTAGSKVGKMVVVVQLSQLSAGGRLSARPGGRVRR